MANSVKKAISLPPSTAEEVARYADAGGLSFSGAVAELCERALKSGFDEHYAPYVGRLVDVAADNAVARIEQLLDEQAELVAELAGEAAGRAAAAARDGES